VLVQLSFVTVEASIPVCRQQLDNSVTRIFLLPGDLLCTAFGLVGESDHRQVLRSFFNMMIWGAITIGVALMVAL